jgi:hypothetical protein
MGGTCLMLIEEETTRSPTCKDNSWGTSYGLFQWSAQRSFLSESITIMIVPSIIYIIFTLYILIYHKKIIPLRIHF